MTMSEHQFGPMHRRLREGGFTYNPRSREYATEGYSVAVHPSAEMEVPAAESTAGHLQGYTAGSAPTWSAPGATEHIGGWNNEAEGTHVMDLPKVFPNTPAGHTESRRAMVGFDEKASFALHDDSTEANPFHSERGAEKYPEFAHMAKVDPTMALQQPEISGWTDSPLRREQFRAGQG